MDKSEILNTEQEAVWYLFVPIMKPVTLEIIVLNGKLKASILEETVFKDRCCPCVQLFLFAWKFQIKENK